MQLISFAILASHLSAAAVGFVNPLSSCGSDVDILNVKDIKVTPYPVIKGASVSIIASGSLSSPIRNGSTIAITLKKFGFTVYSKTVDLCTKSAAQKVFCPIPAGAQTISSTQVIPDSAPAGTYAISIVATNDDGAEIACFSGDLSIVDSRKI